MFWSSVASSSLLRSGIMKLIWNHWQHDWLNLLFAPYHMWSRFDLTAQVTSNILLSTASLRSRPGELRVFDIPHVLTEELIDAHWHC